MAPGFPTREELQGPLRRALRAATSREIDFYVALGYWKLAIILEGVFARYAAGQYGKPTTRASSSSPRSSSASPRPPTRPSAGCEA